LGGQKIEEKREKFGLNSQGRTEGEKIKISKRALNNLTFGGKRRRQVLKSKGGKPKA